MKKKLLMLILCVLSFATVACSSKEEKIEARAEEILEFPKKFLKENYDITFNEGSVKNNSFTIKCGYLIKNNITIFMDFDDELNFTGFSILKYDLTDKNLQNSIDDVENIMICLMNEYNPNDDKSIAKEALYKIVTQSDTNILDEQNIENYKIRVFYSSPILEDKYGNTYGFKKPIYNNGINYEKPDSILVSEGEYSISIEYSE